MSDLAAAPEAAGRMPAASDWMNTNDLMKLKIAPLIWSVQGMVPEGLTIFGGKSFAGKSRIMREIALSVSLGELALGTFPTTQGSVLYLDFEGDDLSRQERINSLFDSETNRPDMSALYWGGQAPALNRGFIDYIEKWRSTVDRPRMIVVDTFQRIRPAGKSSQDAYQQDSNNLFPLHRWAVEHHVAVVLLHHLKQRQVDDPTDSLSGSSGIGATADTVLIFSRHDQRFTLAMTSRSFEPREISIAVENQRYRYLGEGDSVRVSHQRQLILNAFRTEKGTLSPREAAAMSGVNYGTTRRYIPEMVEAGLLEKISHGKYRLPGGSVSNGSSVSSPSIGETKAAETIGFMPAPIANSDANISTQDESNRPGSVTELSGSEVSSCDIANSPAMEELAIEFPNKPLEPTTSKPIANSIGVTTFPMEGIDGLDPSSIRLLRWLSLRWDPTNHTTTLWNLNKVLNAQQIDAAVKDLHGRSLITVSKRNCGKGAQVPWYEATDEGRRVAREANNPGQPDLLAFE